MLSFTNKKVLVTGGSGMIGRKLVDMLVNRKAKVTVISLDKLHLNPKVEYVYGDLADFEFCQVWTEGMDYVFHLAGVKRSPKVTEENPASFFVPMLQMNTNILEACRINNVKGVVYTSSVGAYASGEILREAGICEGLPMDTYPGWAKRMGELQIRAYKKQYGLNNYVAVRPTNVYGEGDNFDPDNAMVIPSLMAKIWRGDNPVIVWGDGGAIRDFAYSGDIARGILLAMSVMPDVDYLNLGSGIGVSIRQLLDTLSEILDFTFIFDTSKPSGSPCRIMDINLAEKLIGYAPEMPLKQGLEKTWNWYMQHREEYLDKKNYFKEARNGLET